MTDADPKAIERAYRDEGERLWRAVFAFAGDRQIADDAVAEAFAQALRRGGALREPARWVWTVAFRIARGELAQRRTAQQIDAIDSSYELPDHADEVVRALAKLSPKQRSAVVLHHYAGYPVKEIAKMLDSTNAAIKVHLSQGRKRLRVLLEVGEAESDA